VSSGEWLADKSPGQGGFLYARSFRERPTMRPISLFDEVSRIPGGVSNRTKGVTMFHELDVDSGRSPKSRLRKAVRKAEEKARRYGTDPESMARQAEMKAEALRRSHLRKNAEDTRKRKAQQPPAPPWIRQL